MTTATRRGVLAVVTIVVLLALGAGVGVVVGDALGIRTEPATQMDPAAPVVPVATRPSCLRRRSPRSMLRRTCASMSLSTSCADAVAAASATRGRGIPHRRRGNGDAADETYRLTGTATRCASRPTARPARCAAIYDLAAQVRAGRSVAEHLGEEVDLAAAVPHGRPGRRRRHPRPGRVGGRQRLLARVEGVRRRAAARGRRTSTDRSPRRTTTSTSSCATRSRTATTRSPFPGSSSS